MKKKITVMLLASMVGALCLAGCGAENGTAPADNGAVTSEASDEDQAAADNVAALIDAIYVQERTEDTDKQCADAKAAWDALTDAQKELVEGEYADPDYFGNDTGDASKDDPRNQDEIGENEILVVSFGTSFNDSRVADIKGIEDAIAAAYPDWTVRRAFTAQIIINHVQARDGEVIDNMDQALARAVDNGVKNLVVQPTHLMHGAEYDELVAVLDEYADKFDSVVIAEPLLGEVGTDATVINKDKEAVATIVDMVHHIQQRFHTARCRPRWLSLDMTTYLSVLLRVSLRRQHVRQLSTLYLQQDIQRLSYVLSWLLQVTMPTMIWQATMRIHGRACLQLQESLSL